MNRPSKGFVPKQGDSWIAPGPSILLHTHEASSGRRQTRLLEGPLDPVQYDGQAGCAVNNHNLPRMEEAVFRAAYPLAEIDFSCRDLPLQVRLQAFNPLVPSQVDDSSIPAAVLRYRLRNPTAAPVEASIAFSLPNFIGADRSPHEPTCYATAHAYGPRGNVNEWRSRRRPARPLPALRRGARQPPGLGHDGPDHDGGGLLPPHRLGRPLLGQHPAGLLGRPDRGRRRRRANLGPGTTPWPPCARGSRWRPAPRPRSSSC